MKRRLWLVFTFSLLALLFAVGIATAGSPVGTGFTYQGFLKSGGSPADGAYDFEFRLFDAAVDGVQVGGLVAHDDVTVTSGLFVVPLDFGAEAFNGEARWLDIGVRSGGETGAYTALSPRQALPPAPYALYASTASIATTAIDADTVDGLHASAFQQHYANVIIVAKRGGDADTITGALNSITDASDTNRYLIKVMPGVYTETVMLKSYVDIEGAGELATRITYTGTADDTAGTVVGADDAELRFLTIENTGENDMAIAILNQTAAPRLTHVTAIASGGTSFNYGILNFSSAPTMTNVTATGAGEGATWNYGVYNEDASPIMTNVTARGSGGESSCGIANGLSSAPVMLNVSATGSGGTQSNFGVSNSFSSPTMTHVSAVASGGTQNVAVQNYIAAPIMIDVTATASGSGNNYGMRNGDAPISLQNSTITASGGTYNVGIFNSDFGTSYTMNINHSHIIASTHTIWYDSDNSLCIGASQLDGGRVFRSGLGDGTITCAGVYDENYAFYPSTCP